MLNMQFGIGVTKTEVTIDPKISPQPEAKQYDRNEQMLQW